MDKTVLIELSISKKLPLLKQQRIIDAVTPERVRLITTIIPRLNGVSGVHKKGNTWNPFWTCATDHIIQQQNG